jgi:hypothetical protein
MVNWSINLINKNSEKFYLRPKGLGENVNALSNPWSTNLVSGNIPKLWDYTKIFKGPPKVRRLLAKPRTDKFWTFSIDMGGCFLYNLYAASANRRIRHSAIRGRVH